MKNVTKYEYNERWRRRDVAYKSLEEELKERVYPLLRSLARTCLPENGAGRPPKVDRAMAAFLAVAKEHGNENTYRELVASEWVEFLGIPEIHYTTIHKAVKRLPPGLLEAAMRLFAERVSSDGMDCVIDATGLGIRKYEKEEYREEERRKRQYAKLNSIWDADKKVFHAVDILDGETHEYNGSEEMYERVNTPVDKLFGDPGYAGRGFVQTVADSGAEPVVKPQSNATPKTKGSPAWRKLVKEYQDLGYEDWRDKTGYGKRFPNEGQFGAFNTRYGDEMNARSVHMAERIGLARAVLHNFFRYLCN
ncbi:hypothetical protein AKJ53_00175 [candidate division MSBL1 archaeon SCGC-AAA382F02]|uniref:Transposase IS4-like domain-containing protein n=1 Tax=candidate division MSBL1 archaeon SCGC-AAA382F02 TaxID=1698282 RepID=A0A133VJ33_9EURY|nr:hypothetical protein AKJ53_00175 [candidate division MSBL1 archaeon SCGC-AAA382F02]